jgi:hypothetical protein
VRDAIAADQRAWLRRLTREVRAALPDEPDPEQLAYTIEALGMGANLQYRLLRDPVVFERAGAAFDAVLRLR